MFFEIMTALKVVMLATSVLITYRYYMRDHNLRRVLGFQWHLGP